MKFAQIVLNRLFVSLLLTFLATVYFLVLMPKAEAHTGNISVSASVCDGPTQMQATYVPTWSNGTDSGVLSWKPGLVNAPGSWTEIGSVNGSSGSTTFTLTHDKSDFSGPPSSSNGPWISFRIVFSDDYTVKGDTRVEGFDWTACIPEQPADKVEIVYGDWTGPAVSCDVPTAKWTRTVTQVTTPYIWDGSTSTWVLGTPTSVQLESEERTMAWPGDLADCTPQPAPFIWVENRLSCDGGYEERTGTQQYVFDYQDTQTWVLDESTTTYTDWAKTRELTDTEWAKLGCPTVIITPTPETTPAPLTEEPTIAPVVIPTESISPVNQIEFVPVLANTGASLKPWVIGGLLALLLGISLIIVAVVPNRGKHRG